MRHLRALTLCLVAIGLAAGAGAQETHHVLRPAPASPTGATAITPEQSVAEGPGSCVPQNFIEYVAPRATLKAAFYYPWYYASPDCSVAPNSDWCNCRLGPKPGSPKPVAGYYGSDDPRVADAHMAQMAAHGIDVVGIEWTGYGRLEHNNFVNAVLPAIKNRGLKFVLLYDLAIRFGLENDLIRFDRSENRTDFVDDIRRLANDANYFKHASYLKFANQPVLYVYITRAMAGEDKDIKAMFSEARQKVEAAGFGGLYLVADHLNWSGVNYDRLRVIRANAATAFSGIDPSQKVSQVDEDRPIRIWADKLAGLYRGALESNALPRAGVIDLTPGIFVQYDDSGYEKLSCVGSGEKPRTVQRYHLRDASDWSYMIQKAGMEQRWVAEKVRVFRDCTEVVTTNTDYTSIVWVYSFNEWGEGAGIEALEPRTPSYPYGFGSELLDTLAGGLSITTALSAPPAPILRTPEGATEGLRPRFGWDEVLWGTQYNLVVRGPGGAKVVDAYLADNAFTPGFDLTANKQHTWQVRAKNNAGWGPFSAQVAFTPTLVYTQAPDAPVAVGPAGCSVTVRPTFTWSAPARAVDYRITVSEVESGALVIDDAAEWTSYTPPVNLVRGRRYLWSVKAQNNVGYGPASDTLSFNAGCPRGDATRDGKADYVSRNLSTGDVHAFVSTVLPTGPAFSYRGVWTYGWGWWYDLYTADVTGDGKADLIARGRPESGNDGRVYVLRANGAATGFEWLPNQVWTPWTYGWYASYDLSFADVTGDGKADLIARGRPESWDPGGVYVLRANASGTGFEWLPNQVWSPWSYGWYTSFDLYFADATGDDKGDLIARGRTTSNKHGDVFVLRSNATGTGFEWLPGQLWTKWGGPWSGYETLFRDVTGDGRVDLVARQRTGCQTYVQASTGQAFGSSQYWGCSESSFPIVR